jgi:hypothetical protein
MNVCGSKKKKKNGWISLSVYGTPYEVGFAHGYLLYPELKIVQEIFEYLVKSSFQITLDKYIQECAKIMKPILQDSYPEYYEELNGIVAGFVSRNDTMTIDYMIAWNSYMSMYTYYDLGCHTERCSAFIACGDATEKGDIVMAHNTHCDYVFARVSNIILQIKPEKGHTILMQCCPGYIASGMDWFICSSGIIGCETTISQFIKRPDFRNGSPYFCRVRYAMQYGNSLDDYGRIMKTNNAGDYPGGWMFGDIHKKEIMLCELGLKEVHIEKKSNGVFYGMNSVTNKTIRDKETKDKNHWVTSTSVGARNVRLHVLLYETYYGKINISNAKKILSDHYDVFLDKPTDGNIRSICKHNNYSFGAIDGKVVNSEMAKQMKFEGIYGNSCGRKFEVKSIFRKHLTRKQKKKYTNMRPFLRNISSNKWTRLK